MMESFCKNNEQLKELSTYAKEFHHGCFTQLEVSQWSKLQEFFIHFALHQAALMKCGLNVVSVWIICGLPT